MLRITIQDNYGESIKQNNTYDGELEVMFNYFIDVIKCTGFSESMILEAMHQYIRDCIFVRECCNEKKV